MSTQKIVPIYLLSGFLGSGKTTLLTQIVEKAQAAGLTPAVLMNELGEVNFDGQLVKKDVAMAEVLGGCICCSMRGDLSLELNQLLQQYSPDLIIVESTGAAHPMETIDAITETSMYKHVKLQSVITIVDGEHLLDRSRLVKDATYRLMQDQIRCGSLIVLNKCDRLDPEKVVEAEQTLRDLNEHAEIITTDHCQLNNWQWLLEGAQLDQPDSLQVLRQGDTRDYNDVNEGNLIKAVHQSEGEHKHHHKHGDHTHVMAYTHYWKGKPSSEQFEQWLASLPANIYRAKGIVTFRDVPSRFLFQFAYRESDFMRIDPQGEVHDVAVFIGEHFDREWLKQQLAMLEL
ncbi:CobW family GTP-binding protein [Paenibacillus endoradicis]|uniref:CobW family GTP-binding protein n=1 Tax=Paenibacillus endoradicis TaxID=2972487 RepID=UPI002159A47B|nr:CobW family GTP-binding protein [Paenibacillus endoradicis]MCR8657098.1 GTP-binding protein [Paenibacillus endoradicis]